jgi:hypothetical protein
VNDAHTDKLAVHYRECLRRVDSLEMKVVIDVDDRFKSDEKVRKIAEGMGMTVKLWSDPSSGQSHLPTVSILGVLSLITFAMLM